MEEVVVETLLTRGTQAPLTRLRLNPQPSGTKATHKVKKTTKQSAFEDPAFAKGYREAYATIYDRNDYAAAIEQLQGARP